MITLTGGIMKRKIAATAATAAAAAALTLVGCSVQTSASSNPAQHKTPQAQGQQGSGGWATIPDTPPPAHDSSNASQACIRQQQDWNLGVGSSAANPGPFTTSGAQENIVVGNDASGLQGQIANPYDQSQVTDQPDRTAITTAANQLLTDLPKAEAKPFPTCADTAGYFPTGMHYYRLAAQAALAGSYSQALADLRKGSDAMIWMTSEPNVTVGFDFSQPTGDYCTSYPGCGGSLAGERDKAGKTALGGERHGSGVRRPGGHGPSPARPEVSGWNPGPRLASINKLEPGS